MSGIMSFIIIVDLDESYGEKRKTRLFFLREKKAFVVFYIYRHVAPPTGLQSMNKICKLCIPFAKT